MNIQPTELTEKMPRVFDVVQFEVTAHANGYTVKIYGRPDSDGGSHRIIAESPAEVALILQAAVEKLTYVSPRR